MQFRKGFTLIELLVVIGIIAILAGIVLVAVNPARQFAQARNTERNNEVGQLLSAVHQYSADNNGEIPADITTTAADASVLVEELVPTYLGEIPTDPQGGEYTVVVDANDRVTVSAPAAELDEEIAVTQ